MTSFTTLPFYFPLTLVAYATLWVAYAKLLHPLKIITGPCWASITRLWIANRARKGDMDVVQRALHQRYGPNGIACADPKAICKTYSTSKPLTKANFYTIWQVNTFSKYPDSFSNTDERLYSERRRIVNNVYSISTVLSLGPYTDNCSELFVKRMGEFADSCDVIDLGDWSQW